jgi:MraZ protein
MLFLSTYTNKIDKKGRVSIPAPFRALLVSEEFSGVVVYESINNKCIEACSLKRIKQLSDSIDNLDPYSDARDSFATILLGGSTKLVFDNEGRVSLPEEITKFAGLQEQVCFVGKGQTFEIWDPTHYEEHYKAAREMAIKHRALLKLSKTGEQS